MRRGFYQLLFIIVIAASAYGAFMAYHRTGAERLGMVVDRHDDRVVRTFAGIDGGYAMVWQAALPWRYQVIEMPAQRTMGFTARFTVPELENLDKDCYAVALPLKVRYRIQTARFFDTARLRKNASDLDRMVLELVQGALSREFDPLLSPGYRHGELLAQCDSLVLAASATARLKLAPHGLELVSIDTAGSLALPAYRVYQEGLLQAADLRKADRQAALDLARLKSRLEQEKLETAQWYDRLRGVSRIIKDNPDVLKYIYIDKMGSNVNVILSSDSSGIPRLLEDIERPATPLRAKKKPVDNLR